MHSGLSRIKDTTDCNSDPLHSLFLTFLIDLYIIDRDFIDSKAVDSLASPFNQRSFLHEEFIWLIPKISFMYLDRHADSLFLEPQLVQAFGKSTYLHIINAILVSFIDNKLGLANLIADIGATRLTHLEELEVSRLDWTVLEGKSHFLLGQDSERLVVWVVKVTSLREDPSLLVRANDAGRLRSRIEVLDVL